MDGKFPEGISQCVRVKKSPFVMVQRIVVLGLVFFFISYLGSAVFFIEEAVAKVPLLEILSYEGAFELLLVIVYVLIVSFIYLSWRATYYELCQSTVSEFRGLFSRNVSELSISRVGMVSAEESFMGKSLGYGTVTLDDFDGKTLLVLRDIENPGSKKDLLLSFMEYRTGRGEE